MFSSVWCVGEWLSLGRQNVVPSLPVKGIPAFVCGRVLPAAVPGREHVRNAGSGGHLDALQWARSNGCPWDY